MPIYKGDEFIERVHKGTEQLRRVYKGNELVYGLYDINYHNKESDYEPSNGEITEYAWGLQRNVAPNIENSDFDDYFDEYQSHWYGWYNDTEYSEKRPQDGDQYIIKPDEHLDLDLYAKWKQKKFSYNITYTITNYGSNSSGGGSSIDTTTQDFSESDTTNIHEDCDDQENPVLPDEILDIINADTTVTPTEPQSGILAELPVVGTFWSELPSSWYGENGGWYWDRVYPGECVWGANGRTGQLRNNAAAAAPYSNAYRGWYNANDWIAYGYGDGHGGNWTSTVDWRKVQVGDCILYGSVRTIEVDDGSGIIYACAGNHVVVVEEVLGNGSFRVSTWNSGGDHRFHGLYVEDSKPGERSSYTGVVSGYLINHIDPVIGASGGSITTVTTVDELEYITSERTFDYNINDWGDWEEVSVSDEDWDLEWGEE